MTWLQFIFKFLSFIEKLLPLLLMANNERLRSKIKSLEAEISLQDYKNRQELKKKEVEDIYAKQSDSSIISNYLHDTGDGK